MAKIRVRIGEWDFSTTSEVHPHIERKVLSLKKKLYVKTCMHGGKYNWILNSKFGSRNCLAAKDVACEYDGKKVLDIEKKEERGGKNLGGEFRHPGFPFLLSNFYAVDCEGGNPPHALNQMLENMSLLFFDDLRERRNSKSFSSEFPVLATTKGLKKCQKQQQDPWI